MEASFSAAYMSKGDQHRHLEHLDELVRYAYALTGSREDAEDIAVEVCAAACHRRLPENGREQKLYLMGMARRKAVDRLRIRSRRHDVCIVTTPDPETTDLHASIHRTLERLGMEHREVLVLKYIHGFTTEEIARDQRKSVAAVNSMLQRARAAFELASEGAFEERSTK